MIGVLNCFVVYFCYYHLDLLKRKEAVFLNILVLIGQTSVPEI